MISSMRELAGPASLAETAYRRADHGQLDELLLRVEREGWGPSRQRARLEALVHPTGRLEKRIDLNGDPTLRLLAGSELRAA